MAKLKNGEVFNTTNGGNISIINYVNAHKVLVRFADGYEKWTDAKSIRFGTVKNPYQPVILGVGYLGEYTGSTVTEYNCWTSMLHRCYNNGENCNPTYAGCTVEAHWHSFSNFLEFYRANFKAGYQLDKDLSSLGNKVYSREFCTFVPPEINALVVDCGRARGKNPVGVSTHIEGRSYRARCDTGVPSERKHIGCFSTPEKAFYAYKEYKEARIKTMAEKYKDVLDVRVYDNLMKYEILITD